MASLSVLTMDVVEAHIAAVRDEFRPRISRGDVAHEGSLCALDGFSE